MQIEEHVGRQLLRRRRILGITQTELGQAVGVRFQQIQKYECGANRITAGRLHGLAVALGVPTDYFYEGFSGRAEARADAESTNDWGSPTSRLVGRVRSRDLGRVCRTLADGPRRQLLDLATALQQEAKSAAAAGPVDADARLNHADLWAASK